MIMKSRLLACLIHVQAVFPTLDMYFQSKRLFAFPVGKMLDDTVEQLQLLFGGTGEPFNHFFGLFGMKSGNLFLQLSFALWRFW